MPYKDPLKQKKYARKHYVENKDKYIESNRLRRRMLRDYIRKIKNDTPCADCKNFYPHYVMDFDHLRDKEHLIGRFIKNNNKSGLEKELKKCEIVCSNCHRIRTYNRINIKLGAL